MISSIGNNVSAFSPGRIQRPVFISGASDYSSQDSISQSTNSVFNEKFSANRFYAQVDRSQWSHRHRFALEQYQRVSENTLDSFESVELLPRIDCRV